MISKKMRQFLHQTVVISRTYCFKILTYGRRVIAPQVKVIIFWENWSFHYHGNWTKKKKKYEQIVESLSIFVILSTFITNKHKCLKKRKQMKLYSRDG